LLLHQEQRQALTQRIDPKIILANSVLQLTSQELVRSIEDELMENPALETLEEGHCSGDCLDPSTCPYCLARKSRETAAETSDFGDLDTDMDTVFAAVSLDSEAFDLVSNLEAEVTLQEHLRNLLHAAVSEEDYRIGEYLISSLDDRGWLEGTTAGIAADLGVDEEAVLRILDVVQSFDPPGIGARSLQECLLLQLCYLCEEEGTEADKRKITLAERMVREQFDHVVARRYPRLARAVGIKQEEARQVVEYIRTRLNPFPASQFRPPWTYRPGNRSAVRPDVLIRRTDLGYEVEVLDVEPFSIGVNPSWRHAYDDIKRGSSHYTLEEKRQITEYVERAEQFLNNLQQRRKTLRLITRCIIDFQVGFLETGSRRFLRPLTRTHIASILHLHESTVSRATANKYVQIPNQEVVPFEIFFNASLSVKEAIDEIIQSEDPSSPLSDQQIAAMLLDRGISVARRTISKYRASKNILSSTRRRQN